MSEQFAKKVTLDVETTNGVEPGMAQVRASVRRTLDEIERDTSSRIQASKKAVAAAAAEAAPRSTPPSKPSSPGKPAKPPAGKGTLGDLKSTFGEESALGNVGKILQGGGAIAGVAVVGNAGADMVKTWKEAHVALATGKKGLADVVDKTLEENVLVGGWYRGVRDVVDILDGTAVEMAKLAERTNALAMGASATAEGFARAKGVITSLVAEKQAIQITVDKEAALRSIEGLPPWLRDAGARRIELTAQLTTNAAAVNKEVEEARKASAERTAKAIASTDDAATKARLKADAKLQAGHDERIVREKAASRDAALKAGFKGATGVEYDDGDAALRRRSEADADRVRDVVGPGADDGSDVGKRLLAGRIDLLKQEAAAGDRAKANEAERLEIQAKYADRARELQKIAETAGDPKQQEEAGRQFYALKQQQQDELAAAARRQADAARGDEVGRRGELTKIAVDALRDEVAAGDRLKGFEAERLEIAQKFLELRKQLLATAEDPARSAEVRAAARKAIADLPTRQQAAEGDVDRRKAEDAMSRSGALAKIEIDALRTRASLGGKSLDLEADRLAIRQKYAEQEIELNRTIATASGDELARAEALKASLKDREAAEVEKAGREALRAATVTSMPSVQSGEGAAAEALRQERFAVDQRANAAMLFRDSGTSGSDMPARVGDAVAQAIKSQQGKSDAANTQLLVVLKELVAKLNGKELRTYTPTR